MGEVLGRHVVARFQRFLLQRLRRSRKGVYSSQNQFQKVYYHLLGTPQSADVLVYRDAAHPLRYFSAWPSDDGKWLFVVASEGTSGTEILYRKIGEKKFRTLLPGFDADYEFVECRNDEFFYTSNDGASNRRLLKLDLNRPGKPEVVIPKRSSCWRAFRRAATACSPSTCRMHSIRSFSTGSTANPSAGAPAPPPAPPGGPGGRGGPARSRSHLSTPPSPPPAFSPLPLRHRYGRLDALQGARGALRPPNSLSPSRSSTPRRTERACRCSSPIAARHEARRARTRVYLYAYGGFQINLTPGFNPSALMFRRAGGIYCVANLRGGSEYGEAWHKAGMLENKQNVFDDFIAAAEYLIAAKYTSSDKLAITGGSNGGLLVGACEVQRPDLFAVCLPAVG